MKGRCRAWKTHGLMCVRQSAANKSLLFRFVCSFMCVGFFSVLCAVCFGCVWGSFMCVGLFEFCLGFVLGVCGVRLCVSVCLSVVWGLFWVCVGFVYVCRAV